MLFVLYGTERLLMDQRLQKLKKEYQCSQELMNYNSYDVSRRNESCLRGCNDTFFFK